LFRSQDEGAFGPFADSGSGSDPFTFSTFSEDTEESAFDSFGDFGDFQTAQDGELTPTGGSWTFESGSSASGASEEDSVSSDEAGKDRSENSVDNRQIDPDRTM
jgi:serine/threonine-protein phosphatase 6 regulatory subunit 3